MGYVPAAWATFGGTLGAVAGALTGLLFVAVSVKGGRCSNRRRSVTALRKRWCCF
jgi:gas vesicle protein